MCDMTHSFVSACTCMCAFCVFWIKSSFKTHKTHTYMYTHSPSSYMYGAFVLLFCDMTGMNESCRTSNTNEGIKSTPPPAERAPFCLLRFLKSGGRESHKTPSTKFNWNSVFGASRDPLPRVSWNGITQNGGLSGGGAVSYDQSHVAHNVFMSHVAHNVFMSHVAHNVFTSHVAHGVFISHVAYRSHVADLQSCRTRLEISSATLLCNVCTYGWVMSRMWMSATLLCNVCVCDTIWSAWDVRYDLFICMTWRIHMCDMTHSHAWHDSSICVAWLIHMRDMTHPYVWHDSFICVTWLIHMCGMTRSYAWHDSSICVAWLIHMRDITHLHVWRDWWHIEGVGNYMCAAFNVCNLYA